LIVSRTFGPTYYGDDLRYPGVTFSFDDDALAEGFKGSKGQTDDKMQEVKRVLISQKPREGEERDALGEVVQCPVMAGEVARAVVKAKLDSSIFVGFSNRLLSQIHDGVTLHFYMSPKTIQVRIGETTAQDLILDLGIPPRIHYKDDERMKIHSVNRTASDENETGCMPSDSFCVSIFELCADFYNYFQYGLDFLISGTTHIVGKIILHTNIVRCLAEEIYAPLIIL
jgi:hypothetical protein